MSILNRLILVTSIGLITSSLSATIFADQVGDIKQFEPRTKAHASEVNELHNTLKDAINTKQDRVSGICPSGSAIREINEDGTVSCQRNSIAVGNGIQSTGSGVITISIDKTKFQSRIAASCPAGESIRAIDEEGKVTCEKLPVFPVGTGNDLSQVNLLGGLEKSTTGDTITFSIDDAVMQKRVANRCQAGEYLRTINQDGSVICHADKDSGGTLTAVNTTAGLTATNVNNEINLDVDFAAVQQRITNGCLAGEAIKEINEDGSVMCAAIIETTVVENNITNITQNTTKIDKNLTQIKSLKGFSFRNAYLQKSCKHLKAKKPNSPSGVYWVKPASSNVPMQVYCDMTTMGGGWTLVWSNLRGGRGEMPTELQWQAAINTAPLYRGAPSPDLESFEVYTGLNHWLTLAPHTRKEIRMDWSNDYNQPVDQRYTCEFDIDKATGSYAISFDSASCNQKLGAQVPGMVSAFANQPFSAVDADNSVSGTCASEFLTPGWYTNCAEPGFFGGSEDKVRGFNNGAYWSGSDKTWGSSDGRGAGNGWIFVR